MPDKFASFSPHLTSPYESAELITAIGGSNQTFSNITRAIYLSTGGTLNCILADGTTRALVLGAGWHPLRVVQILTSGSSSAVGFGAW